MDVDGSGSGGTSADTEPTGIQVATLRQQMGATYNQQEMADSSKMLLMLLKQFVSAVSSDASIDTEVHPEFRVVVRNLCEKAPQAARFLAVTILEYCDPNDCPEDNIESPQPQLDKKATRATTRKSGSSKDPSYRPSKAGMAKAEKTNSSGMSCQPKDGSKFHAGALAQGCVPESVEPPIQEDTITQDRNVEMYGAGSLDNVDASAEDVSLSSPKVTSFRDTILEAVQIIHQFNKHPDRVQREVHSQILQTLQEGHKESISVPNWSDGSMWVKVLEAGESEQQKVTIFNMLEYMGAWEWYNRQVKWLQDTVLTKKKKPVKHKGAATYVLNQMQNLQTSAEQPGKWIGGVGRITLDDERYESTNLPKSYDASVVEQNRVLQRRRITNQLSRGRKLSTRIVKELGLGILFDPRIWEYIKMDKKQLDVMIKNIQANPKQMQLLQILGRQLELLINEGQPDLDSLLTSLKTEGLVSGEEYGELRATFAQEAEAMPEGLLNTAVDLLIKDVSTKVLHEHKRKLKPEDNVTVDGGVDIFCDKFNTLRQGRWLDSWMIMAGMQMSDKPFFVRYGLSIPLDTSEPFGRAGTERRISRPLARWRKKIGSLNKEAQVRHGQGTLLVYFCPLNMNNTHFTLLEINERERKIYHYNSMADQDVIDGRVKLTWVGKMVQEEFGYLKFEYVEAATPQQNNEYSCGVIVVRNMALRANGHSVGDWRDALDDERMRMEMVQGFQACVLDNAMSSRDSKRRALEEEFQELDGFGADNSRRKRLKV